MHHRVSIRKNITLTILTALLAFIISGAVAHSGWTEKLNIVTWVGFGAIVVGFMLSQSLLPTLIAHGFSIIIGSGWSFWVVSRISPADWTWQQKWEHLAARVMQWFNIAVNGGVSYDNEMFILEMSLIVWLAAYVTLWTIFRHRQVWSALVPGGVMILIMFHYAPRNLTAYVLMFLVVSILLIIRFNLMEQEEHWHANHIFYHSEVRFDFFRGGVVFSIVIMVAAWLAPTLSPTQSTELFSNFDREWRSAQSQWNRLFANLNYKPDPLLGANTFSQNLELGGPRTLTATPVMLVQAPAGRYWRAAVYDTYDGQGWESQDTAGLPFGTNNQRVSLPLFRARVPVTQTYQLLRNGATVLYALSDPVAVNRNAHAKASIITPEETRNTRISYWAGKKEPWYFEITFIESDRRLRAEEPYQMVSLLSVATKKQLQNDTAPYPDWILERYIQLPDGIPQRVFNLAAEIVTDKPTTYDKASAIEQYLRTHITYNEGIPLPPADRDKVDYILFDLKQAYCDYYATSMIVMLRSLGIPARLAAGYARGQPETLDNQQIVYRVQNKDAHSWVEVFFPTYGWIEFEPTAAQPAIARLTNNALTGANGLAANTPDDGTHPIDRVRDAEALGEQTPPAPETVFSLFTLPFWGEISIARSTLHAIRVGVAWLLALALMAGAAVWVLRRQGLMGRIPISAESQSLPSVNAVYTALIRLAQWMGIKKYPWQTVYEHAAKLQNTVPEASFEIEFICSEYVRQSFSAPATDKPAAKPQLLLAWEKIRPLLFRAAVAYRNPLRKIRLPFRW